MENLTLINIALPMTKPNIKYKTSIIKLKNGKAFKTISADKYAKKIKVLNFYLLFNLVFSKCKKNLS